MSEDYITTGQFFGNISPNAARHLPEMACRMLQEAVEVCIAHGATPTQITDAVTEETDKARDRFTLYKVALPIERAAELSDLQIQVWWMAYAQEIFLPGAVNRKMAELRQGNWHVTDVGTMYRRPKEEGPPVQLRPLPGTQSDRIGHKP